MRMSRASVTLASCSLHDREIRLVPDGSAKQSPARLDRQGVKARRTGTRIRRKDGVLKRVPPLVGPQSNKRRKPAFLRDFSEVFGIRYRQMYRQKCSLPYAAQKPAERAAPVQKPAGPRLEEPTENEYGDPYENVETRPGTTAAQTDAGTAALAAAQRRIFGSTHTGLRKTATLLGSSISVDFRSQGGTSFLGKRVRTSRDLA